MKAVVIGNNFFAIRNSGYIENHVKRIEGK